MAPRPPCRRTWSISDESDFMAHRQASHRLAEILSSRAPVHGLRSRQRVLHEKSAVDTRWAFCLRENGQWRVSLLAGDTHSTSTTLPTGASAEKEENIHARGPTHRKETLGTKQARRMCIVHGTPCCFHIRQYQTAKTRAISMRRTPSAMYQEIKTGGVRRIYVKSCTKICDC